MADGGYMSTFDVEDDDEHDGDADDAEVGEACGLADTATYRSIIVKRVLSTQVEKLDKQQCHKNCFTPTLSSTTGVHVSSSTAGVPTIW
mgnify:CR=1 FL=1|jgi:hypothetical protein